MNLIEAIKRGKALRRMGRSIWQRKTCHGEHSSIITCDAAQGHWMAIETVLEVCILTEEDILATDWEVQEKEVRITASSFWKAAHDTQWIANATFAQEAFLALATKLGLEKE